MTARPLAFLIAALVITKAVAQTGLVCISELCNVRASDDKAPAFYVNANWSTTVELGSYEVCRLRLNGPVGASSAVVQLWNWQDEACRMGMRISMVERQSETYKLVYDKNTVRECADDVSGSKSESSALTETGKGKEQWRVNLESSSGEEWSLELEVGVAALTSWSKQTKGSRFGFDLAVTFEENDDAMEGQEGNECVSCADTSSAIEAAYIAELTEATWSYGTSDTTARSCMDVTLVCDGFVNCLETKKDELHCDGVQRPIKTDRDTITSSSSTVSSGSRSGSKSLKYKHRRFKIGNSKHTGVDWRGRTEERRSNVVELKQNTKQSAFQDEVQKLRFANTSSGTKQTDKRVDRYTIDATCSFDTGLAGLSVRNSKRLSRGKRDASTVSPWTDWSAWVAWSNWYNSWLLWSAWYNNNNNNNNNWSSWSDSWSTWNNDWSTWSSWSSSSSSSSSSSRATSSSVPVTNIIIGVVAFIAVLAVILIRARCQCQRRQALLRMSAAQQGVFTVSAPPAYPVQPCVANSQSYYLPPPAVPAYGFAPNTFSSQFATDLPPSYSAFQPPQPGFQPYVPASVALHNNGPVQCNPPAPPQSTYGTGFTSDDQFASRTTQDNGYDNAAMDQPPSFEEAVE